VFSDVIEWMARSIWVLDLTVAVIDRRGRCPEEFRAMAVVAALGGDRGDVAVADGGQGDDAHQSASKGVVDRPCLAPCSAMRARPEFLVSFAWKVESAARGRPEAASPWKAWILPGSRPSRRPRGGGPGCARRLLRKRVGHSRGPAAPL